jgi:multimeric flavodoxin WrbA
MSKKSEMEDIATRVQLSSGNEVKHLNLLGISCTAMDKNFPRRTTSEAALTKSLGYAKSAHSANTVMVKLRELEFDFCEGNYSKAKEACTWPCAITQKKPEDQLITIYDNMVNWADAVLIATPIRWGSASALYYKMVERLNCIQNQITLYDNHLVKDKVVGFIVTGGQDNIQKVVGEMMVFWSELGFIFGLHPFVGWSRGWYAEDMKNNYSSAMSDEFFQRELDRIIDQMVEMRTRLLFSPSMPYAKPKK